MKRMYGLVSGAFSAQPVTLGSRSCTVLRKKCLDFKVYNGGFGIVGYCTKSSSPGSVRSHDSNNKHVLSVRTPGGSTDWKPKLIIFDKHGTLLDFHTVWTPWVKSLADKLQKVTGIQLEEKLYKRLNVCIFTKKTRTGLLADGTSSQIKNELVDLLIDIGIPEVSAKSILEECWVDCDINSPRTIRELYNIKHTFNTLHKEGVKIAICTSDSRKATVRTLQTLDLLSYVDVLRCADDGVSDHSSVQRICEELCVRPEDTAVVGDTVADVRMGFDAGVGLTVGVLSGIGTRLDLSPYSDCVVDDVQHFVNMMFPKNISKDQGYQQSPQLVKRVKTTGKDVNSRPSLVIFDKDGTLLCFHSMWTPWAKDVIERLEKETGLNLHEQVLSELGYNQEEEKWTPGSLAEGTQHQNKEIVKTILKTKGLEEKEASKAVESAWIQGNHDQASGNLQLLDNPTALFRILKDNDVKVAICTADSRDGTDQFVDSIGASEYIDLIVCGDDPQTEPKPSPRNALHICETLGVDPCDAIVVGDTEADMGMGRSAKLGATVGVLSGVGGVEDLKDSADHVVSSISDILPFVFKKTPSSGNENFM